MFLLMKLSDWQRLGWAMEDGKLVGVEGMYMEIPGGGRVPVSFYMPVFTTYEHAEAARGDDTTIPIHEMRAVDPDTDPDDYPDIFYEGAD